MVSGTGKRSRPPRFRATGGRLRCGERGGGVALRCVCTRIPRPARVVTQQERPTLGRLSSLHPGQPVGGRTFSPRVRPPAGRFSCTPLRQGRGQGVVVGVGEEFQVTVPAVPAPANGQPARHVLPSQPPATRNRVHRARPCAGAWSPRPIPNLLIKNQALCRPPQNAARRVTQATSACRRLYSASACMSEASWTPIRGV